MVDRSLKTISTRKQCEFLGVWRSNVYYKSKQNDSELANEIHELWLQMPYYGYRRITAELQRRGYAINHKRILRLMRDMRLQALYPRPTTTKRNADHKVYPYLLTGLAIVHPNQVWSTDITYIKMADGFMYLVALIDIYSRYLLSWCLSNTLDKNFCLNMLEDGFAYGKPDIVNTDQGSQFTSSAWIARVEGNGIKVSMDGRGRWIDNIFIERFWRTLKYEHVLLHSFGTVEEAKESIGEFIDTYNNRRLHQSLGYKTPAEVYWEGK